MSATRTLGLIEQGKKLLWQGDFHNGKQLLAALNRRLKPLGSRSFQEYRLRQAERVWRLNSLLVALDADHAVRLRRAPDVRHACRDVYEPGERMVPLRELLGLIGAHQLRLKGVEVPALGARIHPHYGVFAPTRSEYVELAAAQQLPKATVAFDVGTGTGVLAALLAARDLRVVATDTSSRAVACARDNLGRLGLADRVAVLEHDLFPPGRADLVVCNPPWIPARPISLLDHAVYDDDSRMLHGWLDGLAEHLTPGGEGWLILSDLAEHLGLRTRADLLTAIARAGLRIASRASVVPGHRKAQDNRDPLHWARAKEVTSLWRLKVA